MRERLPFKESFPVVTCTSSRSFNLAFRITRAGFLELQNESTMTLACIEKFRDSGFEEMFMPRTDCPVKYDHVIRLSLKGKSSVYVWGFCFDCWRVYQQKVHNVFSHGLSDRLKTVRVTWESMLSEPILQNGLLTLNTEPLLIGISVSSSDKALELLILVLMLINRRRLSNSASFRGIRLHLGDLKMAK